MGIVLFFIGCEIALNVKLPAPSRSPINISFLFNSCGAIGNVELKTLPRGFLGSSRTCAYLPYPTFFFFLIYFIT